MKITGRPLYQIAQSTGLISSTKPDQPGKRDWLANQQHKLISPQKLLAQEEASEWLMKR